MSEKVYDYHRNRCRAAGAGNRGAKALLPHLMAIPITAATCPRKSKLS